LVAPITGTTDWWIANLEVLREFFIVAFICYPSGILSKKGARGKIWAKRPKKGEGRKRKAFSFLFSKQIFQTLFKMKFEFRFLCSKPLII